VLSIIAQNEVWVQIYFLSANRDFVTMLFAATQISPFSNSQSGEIGESRKIGEIGEIEESET
jgi:hypothetical protein